MNATEFNVCMISAQLQAEKFAHRKLIVLSGDITWAYSLLNSSPITLNQLDDLNNDKSCYVFQENDQLASQNNSSANTSMIKPLSRKHAQLNAKNYRHYLGSQCQVLIFEGTNLNIDAFAALSGTLCAGGLLFLLLPNFHNDSNGQNNKNDSKKLKNNLFLQRFVQIFNNDENVLIIRQTSLEQSDLEQKSVVLNNTEKTSFEEIGTMPKAKYNLSCKTKEQLTAVEAIKKVMLGHRNRPLVLTADRGRGKSSALAIACANLIENTKAPLTIIISAPHAQALTVFFQQLANSLPDAVFDKYSLTFIHENLPNLPNSTVRFLPIDVLLAEKPTANLVLIDEAAAIPVYLLEQLINIYHRVVFSTTLHGYEGAGRGFAIKFQQILAKQQPQWQALHIHEPIRWAANDPLEQFVFSSCLLNAKLNDVSNLIDNIAINDLEFTHHNKYELIENETTLSQLFSVLVTAHYQTSPSDLKLMLDNKQVDIVSLSYNKNIVAVALLMHEGECDQQAIDGVLHGKRRLKNQFLPQSLMSYCGFEQAFDYRYLRIMRIAVHPNIQHKGIGGAFLSKIEHHAKTNKCDFLGTSFGANTQLLRFWLAANFKLIRLGFTKDQASGEHSALLLNALSQQGMPVQNTLTTEFYRSFSYLLTEQYQYLETSLVALIFSAATKEQLPSLTLNDANNIDAFANKKRLYSSCVYSLHLWLQQNLSTVSLTQESFVYDSSNKDALFDDKQTGILVARILQKHSIDSVCKQFQLSGKKALNQSLLDYVGHYYRTAQIPDTETSSNADRLR